MSNSVYLFETVGQTADRYLLEADRVLGLSRARPQRRTHRLLRTLLIAAALAALMSATAYAAGLFSLRERIYPIEGTQQAVVVPNGLRSTKTYEGSVAWWLWKEEHRGEPGDASLSFLQGDDRKRKTCELYQANTPEAAEKLYEVADAYGLTLYSESINVFSREKLFALSGAAPYLREGEDTLTSGYVFPDGSFKAEGVLRFGALELPMVLHRFSTGALYPYGGVQRLADYSERELVNALGQTVDVVTWQGGRTELWYLSDDGEQFAALKLYEIPGAGKLAAAGIDSAEALADYVADRVDFAALCGRSDAVQQFLETPRGAADNRDALQRLEDFYHSSLFTAARDFEEFFTARFYGTSFTGVHGQEGYEDISAELERLAEQYSLRYAAAKTEQDGSVRYDNGAVYREEMLALDGVEVRAHIHYMPKDALYTRMIHYVDYAQYQRIWTFRTEEGQEIVCACDGPEKISGVYLFYETDSAYVLVGLGYRDPAVIEQCAEMIDWSVFG